VYKRQEWYEKILKQPWKDSDPVVSRLTQQIHQGVITDREDIDAYRGKGLSNATADKLVGKLDKPKYKKALDYAEQQFKKLYPAKDDIEKHLRYMDFVNHIDQQIATENANRAQGKKPPMSQMEATELVDSYLQEQSAERKYWFDKTYRPVENWLKGETPFEDRPEVRPPIPAMERRFMHNIPREAQERIADELYKSGYKINWKNIQKVWQGHQKNQTDNDKDFPLNF
jgi:hypothetical protein